MFDVGDELTVLFVLTNELEDRRTPMGIMEIYHDGEETPILQTSPSYNWVYIEDASNPSDLYDADLDDFPRADDLGIMGTVWLYRLANNGFNFNESMPLHYMGFEGNSDGKLTVIMTRFTIPDND